MSNPSFIFIAVSLIGYYNVYNDPAFRGVIAAKDQDVFQSTGAAYEDHGSAHPEF